MADHVSRVQKHTADKTMKWKTKKEVYNVQQC